MLEAKAAAEEAEAAALAAERRGQGRNVSTVVRSEALAKGAHTGSAVATDRKRMEQLAVERNTKKGYMYKRGGAARVWRKRWFVIEDGVLTYYVSVTVANGRSRGRRAHLRPHCDPNATLIWQASRSHGDAQHAALGRLNLTNCSVRRPTTDHHKGKYGSRWALPRVPVSSLHAPQRTRPPWARHRRHALARPRSFLRSSAQRLQRPKRPSQPHPPLLTRPGSPPGRGMRLDLDPQAQAHLSAPKGGTAPLGAAHLSGERLPDAAADDEAKGDDGEAKGKYLLAAESLQSLNDWMAAIDFWSAKKGSHARRSVIAADIVREMEAQVTALKPPPAVSPPRKATTVCSPPVRAVATLCAQRSRAVLCSYC